MTEPTRSFDSSAVQRRESQGASTLGVATARGRGCFAALALVCLVGLAPAPSQADDAAQVAAGKKVYDTYCVVCHGVNGDGKGLMGVIHRAQQSGIVVYTYPRDFTAGMYKFRTTPTGSLPTDADLMRTITNGIPRSAMPSHKDLSVEEREAVIAYIKTFSKRWTEQEVMAPIAIGAVPDYVGSSESIARGKQLYDDAGCVECHGASGQGDGPSSPELKDNWGDKILPFDFTSGGLKGGTSPTDIYRTFATGLDGTPMPSYEGVLEPQQGWDIVSYCLELMAGAQVAQR